MWRGLSKTKLKLTQIKANTQSQGMQNSANYNGIMVECRQSLWIQCRVINRHGGKIKHHDVAGAAHQIL